MAKPTPNPFLMVSQILQLPDSSDCCLHATVTRAESIDAYEYERQTRYKQFLLVEDGAKQTIAVRWFGPKFDLRAGDVVQMYPGARDDKAACRIDTDKPKSGSGQGKRIIKVSALGMLITNGPERPPVLPATGSPAPAAAAPNGAPPNYAPAPAQAPANGGNQGPAPVYRDRLTHQQIMDLQRQVYGDRLELVTGESNADEVEYRDLLDIATRLTATVVIAVVDGKIDIAEAVVPSSGPKPAPEQQPAGGQEYDDDIPF